MINWYPGHMAKATRQIAEIAKQIDVVIEIADARAPLFSRCKKIPELEGKPHLLLLNKCDLANIDNLKKVDALPISCIDGKLYNRHKIIEKINDLSKHIIRRNHEKGMNKPIRLLVIGIPNVGKSAFINLFAKKSQMQVGNRPGVTKAQQWLRIDKYELLDTPGVLAPRMESEIAGYALTWIGCIRDEAIDAVEVATKLCAWLKGNEEDMELGYNELLKFGKKQGCLIAGGEVDELRASKQFLTDFRHGKMGKISI